MKLELDVRDQASPAVSAFFAKQMPFIESLALNNTAKDFQKVERERLHSIFKLRRVQWAERSIKITQFATKTRPEVRIAVASPGGRSDILAKFETDTSKGPFRGRSVAVPTEHVPRTGAGIIRSGWRPSQLFANATQHGVGRVFKSKGNVYRGAKGTVLIRRPGGRGTIFVRDGDELRPLYQLVPRVKIRPELEFVETAGEVVNERWGPNFGAAFDRAIRTAR